MTAAAATSSLSADRFALALRSGIHRVIGEQETLNRINVFPVADGDTGTNLSLSLGAALHALRQQRKTPLDTLLAGVADALLDGARGNSGAIVAQFFQGMSDAAIQLKRFTPHTFARAVLCGSEYAHDALSNPKQGTMLSVIAVFADSLKRQTSADESPDFAALFGRALPACRDALQRTRTQLEVLRKAGVVDAGAQGFVALVDGMGEYIASGRVTARPQAAEFAEQHASIVHPGEDSHYRYCIECLVSGAAIDRRKLREGLAEIGDSLILAGTKRKAKIHIHVDDPDAVFTLAARFGTLSGEKADDMHRQQRSSQRAAEKFAVITDSAADIDDNELERLNIHMVPLRVQFGERGYFDKVSISADEFFRELETNPQHPTTSQPSPGDFRRQFQFLASHYDDVLSLNLTGRVSGTLQAARSAAERINAHGKVHVVNTLNASLGQGLIAVFAAECAAAGLDARAALAAIEAVVAETYSFGIVRDLRYAVRGGRVPGSRKLLADLLRLTPVLRSEADGRIATGGALPGRRNLLPKFAHFIAARIDTGLEWRMSIGHAMCAAEALRLEELLRARIPRIVRSGIAELGAALGVHAGPGALVVGLQRHRRPGEIATPGV